MAETIHALGPVLVALGLVALNGLFVAAEFAIVAAPRTAIRRLADEGSAAARLVAWVQSDPSRQDRFIATAQLGITAASLGLGMYSEHAIAGQVLHLLHRAGFASAEVAMPGMPGTALPVTGAAHAISTVTAIVLLTVMHIVLGEMLPKSIALVNPQATALWIGPPMRVVQLACFPLVVSVNAAAVGALRILGVERRHRTEEHLSTPEDLAWIVRESRESGKIPRERADVLEELLEFGALAAAEVMVPRVQILGIALGAGPEDIRELLREESHTRYPVYEETIDRVLGMVHVKDLMLLLSRGAALTARDVRRIPFVPETMLLDRLVATLRDARAQMAIVMDEHGGTAGLITIEDLFEEIVGDITEDSAERLEIHRDVDGCLHVAGTTRIAEVGEELGIALGHEEVDTVSGLVLALLGRPAEVGDVVEWEGLRFEVAAVAGHGVEDCVVTPPPPEDSGGEPAAGGDETAGN